MKKADSSDRYSHFTHRECEYFPCHKGADTDNFNCLFCYCPLYALGDGCGGNFFYNKKGIKDCSKCLVPHSAGGYEYVISKFDSIVELSKFTKNGIPDEWL